jgi:large subunit ribosomal protein L21
MFCSDEGDVVYAVVRIAGKQFRVEPEERLRVPRLAAEVGSELELSEVLAVAGEQSSPGFSPQAVAGARVVVEVLQHDRERTLLVFHKKRRKDHRKKNGHRQPFSEIRIKSIQVS